MKKNLIPAVVAMSALFASATPAYAIERVLSIGQYAFDGSSDSTVTVNTGDTFLIDFSGSRSYTCEAFASDELTDFDFSTSVTGTTTAGTVTATKIGDVVPIAAGEASGTDDNRITITPTTTDRYRITVQSAKSGGEKVRIRCLATTLFGSFNTVVNDFNYMELTNLGNKDVTATVTAITSDGTVAINGATVNIPAQRRFDVDLHQPIGSNKYGFVRVTHNAPLGTLQGIVSQYEGNVNNFSLTATVPLTTLDPRS